MGKYDGLIRYDKLVRDKVIGNIENDGVRCKFHVAGDREYWDKLRVKLHEEVREFLDAPSIGELADIQSVINAIAKLKFGGIEELEKVRRKKVEKRGGFEKRLILEETDNR